MSLLKDKLGGYFYTLELPKQQAVNEPSLASGRAWVLPPITVRFFLEGGDRRTEEALENAFQLLELLFAHQVVDPDLLRLILRATGHRELERREDSARLGFRGAESLSPEAMQRLVTRLRSYLASGDTDPKQAGSNSSGEAHEAE